MRGRKALRSLFHESRFYEYTPFRGTHQIGQPSALIKSMASF
jgi:hypothetical protein